jgi:hypothetical protein|uniref:Uncharacterized protein n=1 Tax=viral metagenome TaxID=1070528 RepID=A0A6C0IU39_9ZZZZ
MSKVYKSFVDEELETNYGKINIRDDDGNIVQIVKFGKLRGGFTDFMIEKDSKDIIYDACVQCGLNQALWDAISKIYPNLPRNTKIKYMSFQCFMNDLVTKFGMISEQVKHGLSLYPFEIIGGDYFDMPSDEMEPDKKALTILDDFEKLCIYILDATTKEMSKRTKTWKETKSVSIKIYDTMVPIKTGYFSMFSDAFIFDKGCNDIWAYLGKSTGLNHHLRKALAKFNPKITEDVLNRCDKFSEFINILDKLKDNYPGIKEKIIAIIGDFDITPVSSIGFPGGIAPSCVVKHIVKQEIICGEILAYAYNICGT